MSQFLRGGRFLKPPYITKTSLHTRVVMIQKFKIGKKTSIRIGITDIFIDAGTEILTCEETYFIVAKLLYKR